MKYRLSLKGTELLKRLWRCGQVLTPGVGQLRNAATMETDSDWLRPPRTESMDLVDDIFAMLRTY